MAETKFNEDQINKFVDQLVSFHGLRVNEQLTDQDYYDDKFKTSVIQPFTEIRTGNAARIVDNIVAHVQGAVPLVYREPKKATEGARRSAEKVARMLNYWIRAIVPELDEAIRNAVLRGEFLFQIQYNPAAYTCEHQHMPNMMPVLITSPDPIVTFTFPYDQLYPTKVAKKFQVDAALATTNYPELCEYIDPLSNDKFEYRAYWDCESRYFRVGSFSPTGIQENIYGFTPFVHGYSGLGKRQYDGRPESMAVGKLRYMRATLKEDCEMASRIGSIIALYANPLFVIRQKDANADLIGKQELTETVLGPGQTIAIPYGWEAEIYVPNVASAQLFQHYDRIQERLGLDSPTIMSGVPNNSRTTGIQEDIEFGHVFKRYQKMVYNLERALEAALGRALEILDKTPDALPLTFRATSVIKGQEVSQEEQITQEDIAGYYDCHVVLNPENDAEDDRDFMKYRIMVNEGKVPWKEFLIKGLKKTEWEADDLIAQTIAEQAVRDNPLMQQARVQEALEQMNMSRYLDRINGEIQGEQQMTAAMGQGQGYRPTEIKNPLAAQQLRGVLSGRQNQKGLRESPMPQMSGGQPFVPAQGGQENG